MYNPEKELQQGGSVQPEKGKPRQKPKAVPALEVIEGGDVDAEIAAGVREAYAMKEKTSDQLSFEEREMYFDLMRRPNRNLTEHYFRSNE